MFKNIWRWITGIIGDLAKFLEKPAAVAVQIVNVIKEYVGNPMVDLFTMLTRTGIDDKIVAKIREYLPGVLATILKAENIIKEVSAGDFSSLLRTFADYINSISPEARGKWWAELASMLLQVISNKPVDKATAYVVTQGVYIKAAVK